MPPNNEQILVAISEQAAAWFVENRSGPLNSEARASFIAWLRASPVHVQEYLGIAALAGDLAAAVNDPQVSPESLLAEARVDADNVVNLGRPLSAQAPARPRLRVSSAWSLASAAAATIVIVASAAIWLGRDGERFGLPKTYSYGTRGTKRAATAGWLSAAPQYGFGSDRPVLTRRANY